MAHMAAHTCAGTATARGGLSRSMGSSAQTGHRARRRRRQRRKLATEGRSSQQQGAAAAFLTQLELVRGRDTRCRQRLVASTWGPSCRRRTQGPWAPLGRTMRQSRVTAGRRRRRATPGDASAGPGAWATHPARTGAVITVRSFSFIRGQHCSPGRMAAGLHSGHCAVRPPDAGTALCLRVHVARQLDGRAPRDARQPLRPPSIATRSTGRRPLPSPPANSRVGF